MKIVVLLFLSMMLSACYQTKLETPKQRFNIFMQAIQSNQMDIVEQSLKKGTYQYLKKDAGVFDPEESFIKRLIRDTKKAKPSYLGTEWVLRNKIARVNYSYIHNQTDFLILEKRDQQWYINLFQKEKYRSSHITKFVTQN
ncbi:hypothetical protein MJH12_05085 [bacterium]|nr:hypothetical protein [bacterium]